MSQENVEIVLAAYDRVNAGLDDPPELFDPDYEFDARDVAPAVGIVRGLEAVEEALREYWDTFEDFHIEFKEVLHADEEHVVADVKDGGRMNRARCRGPEPPRLPRLTSRNGQVLRISPTPNRNEPSKPPGLRSSAAPAVRFRAP